MSTASPMTHTDRVYNYLRQTRSARDLTPAQARRSEKKRRRREASS